VKDKIVGIVSPALEELTKPIMTPICNCLMGPLVAAYKQLVLSYHKRMTTIISEGSTPEELEKGINYFNRQIRWWWGPMRPALRQIYRAFREGYEDDEPETSGFTITVNIGDILDCFQGVRPWQVEDKFESKLRETMGAAIFTFADTVTQQREGGTEPDLNAILSQVTRMMVHDAHIYPAAIQAQGRPHDQGRAGAAVLDDPRAPEGVPGHRQTGDRLHGRHPDRYHHQRRQARVQACAHRAGQPRH